MKDEITLKEAAEYVKDGRYFRFRTPCGEINDPSPEDLEELKRLRETGEATAVLDAMLAASRHGKIVKGQG